MSVSTIFILLLLGALAGYISGLVGIGGSVILVPTLVLLGFSQYRAQGTSLALLIPPSHKP
ncbi:TSUP family transporter [Fibrella sp. HMF5335]|uniref:Probable membrane transporter protein n=1 Tax=Fibrella rubiginis TaxID=2817060 RepID=A0A939GH47_9BACT|nr:TSUP family transporter [Fibrella rubiginis]MBO0936363.1 TSUP family transporter [Fibrella rubiginis]